jgi:hypothetical protein
MMAYITMADVDVRVSAVFGDGHASRGGAKEFFVKSCAPWLKISR